jgi:DNA-binding MarR family transcriptional regulator
MEPKTPATQVRASVPPLIFDMMRLWKQQFAGDDESIPSFLHCETMRYIGEQGQPSMRSIASYLKVAPPSATALINSMVEDGFLERFKDASDRRIVRLSLTKKGTAMLLKVQDRRTAIFEKLINPLSDEDCRELARILTRITVLPDVS